MSRVSSTPSAWSNSSAARTRTTRAAASRNGSSGATSMSCAFATFVSARAGELEDDGLAQPAAADLQRHADAPGGRVEHQYARRQQLCALGREAVATREHRRRRGPQLAERALQRGGVEHGPD